MITREKNILIFKEILPTSAIINIWRTVRKTCLLMLGWRVKRGLSLFSRSQCQLCNEYNSGN